MKISKTRRREIEEKWQAESLHVYSRGKPLCTFTRYHAKELVQPFKEVWNNRPRARLSYGCITPDFMCAYMGYSYDLEEAYLLRALTLNMLLDDNEGGYDD